MRLLRPVSQLPGDAREAIRHLFCFFVFNVVMRIQVSEAGGPASARPLPGDPQGHLWLIHLCDAAVPAEVWVSGKYVIQM